MLFGISNAVVLAKANNYKIKEYKEDVMKALATIMGIIAPATAFAASEASGEGSGLFVWIFLGFFALIVVGQLVPAVMLISGMIKGLTSKTEAEVKTEVK